MTEQEDIIRRSKAYSLKFPLINATITEASYQTGAAEERLLLVDELAAQSQRIAELEKEVESRKNWHIKFKEMTDKNTNDLIKELGRREGRLQSQSELLEKMKEAMIVMKEGECCLDRMGWDFVNGALQAYEEHKGKGK